MTKHECRKKLEIQARRSSPAWQPESTRSPLVFSASSAPSAAFVFFRSSPFPHWQAAACQCHPATSPPFFVLVFSALSAPSAAFRLPAFPTGKLLLASATQTGPMTNAEARMSKEARNPKHEDPVLPGRQCDRSPLVFSALSAPSAATVFFVSVASVCFPTGKLLVARATPGPLPSSPRSPRPPRLFDFLHSPLASCCLPVPPKPGQ